MKEFSEIQKNVIKRLKDGLPSYLHYHDVSHTEDVISKAIFLAELQKLSQKNTDLIKIAALYHDSGFLLSRDDHEEKSCKIAESDLSKTSMKTEDIDTICLMIQATKIPQRATNTLQKILADADLFYLGTNNYKFYAEKLYREIKHFSPEISSEEWYTIQIDFMEQHSFFTGYGKSVLRPVKLKNLAMLKNSAETF